MKILIIDPQFITRTGLIHLLTAQPGSIAIYEATDMKIARDYLESGEHFDLIFTELELPDCDHRYVANTLRQLAPKSHVILFTWKDSSGDVQAALSQGAQSYLCKNSSGEEVKLAIHGLLQNKPYLPDSTSMANQKTSEAERKLSPRQREIMQLLAQGLSNKEIASILGITEGTIRVHLSAIFKAIKVSNRTEATLWYLLRQG